MKPNVYVCKKRGPPLSKEVINEEALIQKHEPQIPKSLRGPITTPGAAEAPVITYLSCSGGGSLEGFLKNTNRGAAGHHVIMRTTTRARTLAQ